MDTFSLFFPHARLSSIRWFLRFFSIIKQLYYAGVLDGIVRGQSVQPARVGDQSITAALTTNWLQVPGSNGIGLDIAALTIQVNTIGFDGERFTERFITITRFSVIFFTGRIQGKSIYLL